MGIQQHWSLTPADNQTADAGVNQREGMAPSQVNDAARTIMARLKAFALDISGKLVTGGTATAYTVTTNEVITAYTDGFMVAFRAHASNTGAATIAVDGLAAKPLRKGVGVALAPGDLVGDRIYRAVYRAASDEFILHWAPTYGQPGGAQKNLLDYIPSTEWAAILNYTSTTDLSTYLQAAIDAAETGGFQLFAPAGRYRFGTGLTMQANNVVIHGEGDAISGGTQFEYTATSGNIVVLSNAAQNAGLDNLRISSTVRHTSGYAVVVTGDCFRARLTRLRIDYCNNGILIDQGTGTIIKDVTTLHLLGARGIQYGGAATKCFECTIEDYTGNNPYPLNYGPVKTWAISTAFNAGDIILNNGNIYQCSTSGTSLGSGTGPTGFPSGSTPQSAFENTISDGTCAWKFVSNGGLIWIVQDSNAYSLRIRSVGLINGNAGFLQGDGINSGSSYPIWAFVFDMECDHNFIANVVMERGEGFYATTSWWGSCLNGNAVRIDATYRGEVVVSGGTRIAHARNHGILLNAGPVDVVIDGCVIGDNSQSGSGNQNGIEVAAGATRFQITNSRIGDIVGTGGNNQAFGIAVNTGASDNYVITGNQLSGNVTAGLADNGTGTNKQVHSNAPDASIKSFSPTAGIGYGTGAGGTVTQLTSKSTAVTLNKIVGQITMHNAALGGGAKVGFTMNNSAIGADDAVLVFHRSAGTQGAYDVFVSHVAAGTAGIQVRNNTGGSLSEAIALTFIVLKGVTA